MMLMSSPGGSLQVESEPEEPVWREPQGGEPAPSEPECGNQRGPMEEDVGDNQESGAPVWHVELTGLNPTYQLGGLSAGRKSGLIPTKLSSGPKKRRKVGADLRPADLPPPLN